MPIRVSWPVERWPAADQAAWTQAQQRGNPMTPAGKAATWRPESYKAAIGAYWLVKDMAPADFKTAQRRLAEHYGTDRTVCNPSRVMRIAGTVHHKGGNASPGYTVEGATRRGDALPAAEILAGLPEIAAKVEAVPSAVTGEPVTLGQLRVMLSHMDPSFKDAQLTWLSKRRFSALAGPCFLAEGNPRRRRVSPVDGSQTFACRRSA